jgi:dTMP kinase
MANDSGIDINTLASFRAPAFPGSYFLSFEGIEGAGKSTQIIRVREYLESKGFKVDVLREPGGTSFGERLRKAILDSQTELHPLAEAHLFASSRAQLLHEVLLKDLSQPGHIIICDRYLDSSLAYQGVARGVGIPVIIDIHKEFPLNIVPHLTFYLEIDVETSMQRQKMRNAPKDYFESKGADFYKKLITGYQAARELFPKRIKTIDGKKNDQQVFAQITKELDVLINS